MITLQLYIHTIISQRISAEERSKALLHYVEAYADFGMQCAEYKSKTIMKYDTDKA